MARLKNFSELYLKKDKDLPNLKIPAQGPKGTPKYSRMKIAYTDAPGTSDIKKAIKAEAIVDPNDLKGRPKKADPNPESPYGIKHPLHPANLKKKKAKSEASSPSVLKPTKPSDITKHARTLAKNPGDYERNKKKYIDKARAKVFRMYPKESLNGLMKEDMSINEKMLPIVKVMRKNKRLIDNELGASHKDYKAYVMIDDEYLDRLNDFQSELIFSSLKKNKGVAYPENDITAYFKNENNAKQFVKDLGGPGSMYGKYGRLDINLTALGRGIKKESIEATWPDEMPNEDVDEALSMSQRIKKSRIMKRMKARIKIGRERAKRKMAPKDKLEKRANRQARNQIASKLTRGIPKRELSFARKQEIEKRLDKPALKQRIKRLAKRLFKDVRKKEVQRKKG